MRQTPEDIDVTRILPAWSEHVQEYRPPAGARAPSGPLRGGHPKGHGIVHGALTIGALPPTLAVGLFAAPRTFPCRMRFSNVQGGRFSDTRDLRGLAVKLLDPEQRHTLQDFLCSSAEILPRMDTRSLTPQRFLEPMEALLARDPHHPGAPSVDTNLLTARWYSITPYGYGRDRACKYAFFPRPDNPPAITLDRGGADDLASSLAHNLAGGSWRLDLCIQLADGHSLDDTGVPWGTPWHTVGTLVIAQQDVTSPLEDPLERRMYSAPTQCHPDHRPLGALAQVRRAVYAASRTARGVSDEDVAFPFRPWKQRVAVIGGGGAGLAAAAALAEGGHSVVVYEAAARLGGHAVSVAVGDRSIDPGFGVFTPHTHPNLIALCARWGIPLEPLQAFSEARSWRTPDGEISYTRFTDLPFARSVLEEAATFQREALPRLLRDPAADDLTLGEYLDQSGASRDFVRYFIFGQVVYLFPGHPEAYYRAMPLRPLLRHAFDLSRHGEQPLLRMKGGSGAYIAALVGHLGERGVQFVTRASAVVCRRGPTHITLRVSGAEAVFDHVILAIPPHRALEVLGSQATPEERAVLGSVGHTTTVAVAHLDPAFLPRDPAHHTYHNILVPPPSSDAPFSLIATKRAPCSQDGTQMGLVTHDYSGAPVHPAGPSARVAFEHVHIDRATFAARAALPALQGVRRTWFAGSWTRGLTWHDDAIASGLLAANGIMGPTEERPVAFSYATAPDRRTEATLPLVAFADVLAAMPDKEILAFADDTGRIVERHTPRTLDTRTRTLARALLERLGARRGDRIVLAFPPGLAFFEAFVACMRAGLLPVPVYPPVPGATPGDLAAFAHIVSDAAPRFGLCPAPFDTLLPAYLADVLEAPPALPWHALEGPLDDLDAASWRDPSCSPHEPAFLQYTSGSTGAPKGVIISHGNLAHQAHSLCAHSLGLGPDSVCVSWLPMYHDFALITGLLLTVQLGLRGVFLSPLSFTRRPALWMEVCDRERATATAAPDFAYALVVRRTHPEQRAAWDLSCLRVVMSASEPVRPETVDTFLKAFRPAGLSPRAFCPAYGLAEHTVGVTIGGKRLAHVDRVALATERRVRPGTFPLAGNGAPPPGVEVRIVDPDTHIEKGPGEVGEIWVDSPSKAIGYWGRPEASAERFAAHIHGSDGARGWLRTGDEGFLSAGELFVTGRLKDIIVTRGRNHAAPDLERALDGAHPALRPGGLIVVQDPLADSVLVAAELATSDPADGPTIARALRARLVAAVGLSPGRVVLVPPRTLPRTTSGKLQRARARTLLAEGALPILHQEDEAAAREPDPTPTAPRRTLDTTALLEALTRIVSEHARVRLDPDEDIAAAVLLDSLQAVELGVAIERMCGRPVPVTELRRFPTLRALARHLAKDGETRTARLLARPPEAVPSFLLPPLFGRAGDLEALASALGRERRVYALEREDRSLADIVASHAAAIEEILDGQGRCVLVGVSFGGLIAHATASALRRHGIQVPRLVMLDTYHPAGYADTERPTAAFDQSYAAILLAASLRVPLEDPTDLPAATARLLPAYQRRIDPRADAAALLADLDRHAAWMREAAARDLGPPLSATTLVYVQASERPAANQNLERWRDLFGATQVHPAPGDHFAVIRDAARNIAPVLPTLREIDR